MRSFIFIASLFRDTRFWSEVGSNALLLLADTTSVIALISHWLLSILCNVVLTCCQHTLSMIDGSYFLCGNGSSSESLVFISRYLSTYLFVSLMFKLFYTVLTGYVCYRKEKKRFHVSGTFECPLCTVDRTQSRRLVGTRGPYLIYHSIVAERRPTPTG